MTLTEANVACLEEAGERCFYRVAEEGSWQLVNVDGRCVFLAADGACSMYERRPEGCALYPLVLDLASGRVVRDAFCPHRWEFPSSRLARHRLTTSVAREEEEARLRRQAARSQGSFDAGNLRSCGADRGGRRREGAAQERCPQLFRR